LASLTLPRHALVASAMVLAALQTLCAAPIRAGSGPDLPDEVRLRARLQAYYKALGERDLAAQYAILTPTLTRNMTLEQFTRYEENKAARLPTEPRWNLSSVELVKNCFCGNMGGLLRCSMIIKLTEEGPDHKLTTSQPLDMWEYGNGEWYHGMTFEDSGGKCPPSAP
jgi:hypothetical protein